MTHASIYGHLLYIGTSPVTVVGERYNRVYYVEGHHKLGDMDSGQFRSTAHRRPDTANNYPDGAKFHAS